MVELPSGWSTSVPESNALTLPERWSLSPPPAPPRRPVEFGGKPEAVQSEPIITDTVVNPPAKVPLLPPEMVEAVQNPAAIDPMTGTPIPQSPNVKSKPDLTTIPGVAYYSGAANLGSQDPADVAALQRSLDAIAKREADRAKNPTKFSQVEKEKGFIAAAQEDFGGFAKETGQAMVEGIVPMGATIAGALGGPGGVAAAGAFSFGADAYARALIDQTRKRGGDLGDAEQFNAIYMKNKAEIDLAAMKEAGISFAQGAIFGMIPGGGGLKGMLKRVAGVYPAVNITGSSAKRMVNDEEPATGEEILKEYVQGVATGLPFEAAGFIPSGGGKPKGPPSNRLLEGPQGGGRGPEGGQPTEGGPAGGGAAEQPQARNQTVTEAEILKGGKFGADDIAVMSPQERAATARDLAQQGIKPEPLTPEEYNQIFKPRTTVEEGLDAASKKNFVDRKKKETEDRLTRIENETKNEFFAVLKGDGLSTQEIGQLSWPEVTERVRDIRSRKADKPISLTPEEKIELNLPLTKADQKALDKKTPPTTPPVGVEGRGPETPPASGSLEEQANATTTVTGEKPATDLAALTEQIRRQKENEARGGRPIDEAINELPKGKDGNPDLGVLQLEIKKRTPNEPGNTPWENLAPWQQDDIIKGLQSLRPPVPNETTTPPETPSVEEPTGGTKPTTEEPPVGGKKPSAVEEEVSAPQTPTGEKPTAEPETAPVEHAFTFKTSKGSEYEMTTDGKTIRNKAARPEHPGDEGIKPQSEKTVFLDRDAANALAPPENKDWIVLDNGNGTVSLATQNADGQWGMSPSQKDVPYTTVPEIGKYPLELWQGIKSETLGATGFKNIHFGNEVVTVSQYAEMPEQQKPQGGKEGTATPEETKPLEEEAVTPPAPPVEEEKPKPKEEEAAPPVVEQLNYDFFGPNSTKIDNIAGVAYHHLSANDDTVIDYKSLVRGSFASEGRLIKLGDSTDKEIQEGIELALVLFARQVALNDPRLPQWMQADTSQGKFDVLKKLYEKQPKLTARTSESIMNQAYSTPIPLAYVASRLAGVNWNKSVLEPTAGNGALVIEANPEHTTVNEINRLRRDNLKALGFTKIEKNDASDYNFVKGKFDVIIANPPFGTVKAENGSTKSFDMDWVQNGYQTSEIDHAISHAALDHMNENGNAVLIIGSVHPMAVTDKARSDAYNGKAKREFFKTLYDNYNVTDHFTVAGKLYERQGAAWPVDVIVIKGKGKSALPLPAVKVPPLLTSWEQIKEKIPNESEATTVSAPTQPVSETGGEGVTAGTEPSGQLDVQERPPIRKPKTKTAGSVRGEPNAEQSGSGVGVDTGELETSIEGPKSERFNQLATPKQRDIVHEEETETQLPYSPKARQSAGLGTLAPANMKSSMEYALNNLEDKRGDIDAYVADRLKYKPEELAKYYSGEQIDALALAIDNLEKGSGFIIGDQTGIGKGRINAGIIRYALVNKLTPIFVTEKDNLYKDMWRDMSNEEGVGIPKFLGRDPKILITDLNKVIDLDEEADGKKIRSPANVDAIYNSSIQSGKMPNYDMIFTTYSQMQTVKGESPLRRKFLESMASNSILILDESHNAGGGGAATRGKDKNEELNRAEFVRDMTQKSQGTFFSSATFAKRPDVMDLYAKTDIGLAVDDISKLPELLVRGGVPLMSVLSSMLAKSGQYMRRERTFAGVKYEAKLFPVDKDVYNDFSKSMMKINEFSQLVNSATKDMKDSLKAQAGSVSSDGSTGGAGLESTNFTSIMHNLINQLLLSMKSKPAIEAALKAIKDGQKPVLTVANTMESFLKDMASQLDLKAGDTIEMTFGDLLLRYLDRTRTLTLKEAFSKKGVKGIKHYMTDEELGPAGIAAYKKARNMIEGIDFGGLPISPIDYIKYNIEKKGYKVGEITGRQMIMNYGGDGSPNKPGAPVLANRPSTATTARGKNKTIADFNNGTLDAIIINKSGSTGLSLHAKKGFKDVRQRHMIIVQPNENIDTHMQTLGRVHRTGQVIVPEYTQMIADIPAEKRPAAVLAKKMASMNAITTSARKSALTAENVPDFINEYGDKVAAQFLRDNPDLQDILGIDLGDKTKNIEDLMRRLTGRIPLLEIEEQTEIYEILEARYADFIQQLELSGGNALETKRLDLDAKLIESAVAREATGDSPFTGAVMYGLYDIKRMGKPITARDAIDYVLAAQKYKEETSDIDTVDDAAALTKLQQMFKSRHREMVQAAKTEFNDYERKVIASTEGKERQAKQGEKLTIFRRSFDQLSLMLVPGQRIRVTLPSGETGHSLVINVGRSGKSNNPLVPSDWRVTLAFPSGTPIITVPFSQIQVGGDFGEKLVIDDLYSQDSAKSFAETFNQLAAAGAREKRVIITGNILAGFDIANGEGQIINFTKDDGKIEQGILLRSKIKTLADATKGTKEKIKTVEDLKSAVSAAAKQTLLSNDPAGVIIKKEGGYYTISVPSSKSKAGKYILDTQLIELIGGGGLQSSGSRMQAKWLRAVDPKTDKILERILAIGASFDKPIDLTPTSYSVLRPALKTETAHVVPEAYKEFEGIIKRTLGEKARVEFVDQIKVTDSQAAMDSGGELDDYASGSHDRLTNMIYLATSLEKGASLPDATYHEAWHSLEDKLTPAERKAIADARPENNRLVAQYYGVPVEKIEALSTSEQDAYAMGMFGAKADDQIRNVAMGRASYEVFGKVWLTYRRFRNVVNKLFGKRSMDSIFNDFYVGGMSDRLEMEADVMADKMGVKTSDLAYMALRQKRKGPPTPQSYEVHDDTLTNELMYGLVDKYNDISMIQRAIEKSRGSKLPETMDVEMSIGLFNNRVIARQEKVWDKELQPLLDEMAKLKIEEDDLVRFLYARHAPERNAKMAKRDPKRFPSAGSGMENDVADDIIDGIKKKGLYDTLVKFDEKFIRPILKADLDERLAAGLLTQDQYDEYTKPYDEGGYDFYVPLRGYAEQDADAKENARSFGRGFSVSGKEYKAAMGRKSEAYNVFHNLIQQRMDGIVRQEKNRVDRSLYLLVKSNPNPDFAEILDSKNMPMVKYLSADGTVRQRPDTSIYRDEMTIPFKISGESRYIVFNDDNPSMVRLVRSLKNLPNDSPSKLAKFTFEIGRFMSKINTAWVPDFFLTNFPRDVQDAMIALYGTKEGFATNFMTELAGAGKIIAKAETVGGLSAKDKALYDEWILSGGKMEYGGFDNLEKVGDKISREMFKAFYDKKTTNQKLMNGMMESGRLTIAALEKTNQIFESTVRFAVYLAARKGGYTQGRAADLALNATVNFQKKGAWMPGLNAIKPFLSASVGGIRNFARFLMSKRFRRALYGIIFLAFLTGLLGVWMNDDDKNDPGKNTYYTQVKGWERSRNVIIPIKNKEGNFYKFDLGFLIKSAWNIGDNMAAVATGNMTPEDAAVNIAASAVDSFNPASQGSFWSAILPWFALPVVQLAVNKDSFGNRIHPEPGTKNAEKPASEQYSSKTPNWTVDLASYLNRITGGDEFEKGKVDLYPGTIDYWAKSIAGQTGQFVQRTYKSIEDGLEGIPTPMEESPLFRRLVTKTAGINEGAYYDKRKEVFAKEQLLNDAWEEAKSSGSPAAERKVDKLTDELGIRTKGDSLVRKNSLPDMIRKNDKILNDYRDEIAMIKGDDKLSPLNKKKQITEIEGMMREYMDETRSYINSMKDPEKSPLQKLKEAAGR
jgi:predicted RNA methylase